MPITLVTPERAATAKDLEIRPKQVKAWIDSLPQAQNMDSARKMTGHLAALNRTKIDNDSRLQILDAYRMPAATAPDELDAGYSKARLLLAPKGSEALMVPCDLAAELSMGYQIILVERGAKLFGPYSSKKGFSTQVLRALEY